MTALADRLERLFAHLGIERAFVATQMPGDIADLSTVRPDCVAGLTLVIPSRITTAPFQPLGHRLMMITGETGVPAETVRAALTRLPEARLHTLTGYETTAWSDIALERGGELCTALLGFFQSLPAPLAPRLPMTRVGRVAGISYRIAGSGPALILPPFFLAASQWEPVIDILASAFTVIVLGGPYIGGVALLEDRADLASFRDLLTILTGRMAIPTGAGILEIGCGTAALCRQMLAARSDLAVTGLDSNAYLLREGAALAVAAGIAVTGTHDAHSPPVGGMCLIDGDATALPFPDESFDAVYSITVLEECDARAALAEMCRVLRPGGSAGVAVRAIDLPQWWNLDLPPALTAKVNRQPQSVSPAAVADRSLYVRMAQAGFRDIEGFPFLVTFDRPDGPIWAYRAAHARGLLDAGEQTLWDTACNNAAAAGLLFQANPVHCAVGRRR